ncbi:TBC1 domain family member 5 homolog A-like isoform X2 [Mytilus trossulus]|uniref:TBC1 domain family member 5 homolog A-like isoform X2 n=1 Tax=Mytilus trossulus TaxID=6551 RepID=UPI00300627DC
MGSGSSKEKSNDVRITSQNTDKKSDVLSLKSQVNSNSVVKSENIKNSKNKSSDKQLNGNTNKLARIENNNKTNSRIPQPFDESSDDDADDLLKDEWRSKNKSNGNKNTDINSNGKVKTWQPPEPPKGDYPETYAQKLQREQYTQQQLLRQKTIYRNPDEWEIDQVSQQSFDVSKFKEVNKTLPKTDIFGPVSNNDYSFGNMDDDNYYRTTNNNRKKSIPRYDVSEEDLMNDIESHYY